MSSFRHKKDPHRADRLTVWLPNDRVYGRVGQHTVEGPNGERMSMSAAAKMAGVPRRTVIERIRDGRPKEQWYFKGNLRRPHQKKIPVKYGPALAAIRGVDQMHNGRVVKRKRKDASIQTVKRPRVHAQAVKYAKRSLAKAARAKAAAADQGSAVAE